MRPKVLSVSVILFISLFVSLPQVHADQSAGGSLTNGGCCLSIFGTNNVNDDRDGKSGVCFTASASGNLIRTDFYLGNGGATGTIEAQIYSTTGAIEIGRAHV